MSDQQGPTREIITEALKDVKFPGLSRDIVSFGMVKEIAVEGGTVTVQISTTSSDDSVKVRLEKDIVARLSQVPGVTRVNPRVEVAAPPKLNISTEPERYFQKIPRVIAVGSGKGGVGKSTVAANLAAMYAKKGFRTGLLDADIYGPSQQMMMGIKDRPHVKDQKIIPITAHGVANISLGMLVDPDKAMVWRGPMVAQAFEQLMRDVLWPDLEVMVIDLPPGTGDVQLTMSQKVDVTAAVIVTTPQEVALIDARKAVNMFQMVKVPIAGIVENMSYYLCRQCGAKDYIFGRNGARSAAERMHVPFLGEIPLNTRIRTAGDEGTPPVLVDEEQERIFAAVVDQIEANLVTA